MKAKTLHERAETAAVVLRRRGYTVIDQSDTHGEVKGGVNLGSWTVQFFNRPQETVVHTALIKKANRA